MRLYDFNLTVPCYEDELPQDMTDEDYSTWHELSYVDFVRIGPMPILLRETR